MSITLTGNDLTLAQVERVARRGVGCEVAPSTRH
jgi:hypothetical protein